MVLMTDVNGSMKAPLKSLNCHAIEIGVPAVKLPESDGDPTVPALVNGLWNPLKLYCTAYVVIASALFNALSVALTLKVNVPAAPVATEAPLMAVPTHDSNERLS